MVATELAHAWAGMVAALEELAPLSAATIRPPEPGAVARLEAAVEADLTDELCEWFTLHGGTPPRGSGDIGVGACLFPEGYLTSVDEAIEYDAWWRQERFEFGEPPGHSYGEAGEPAGIWIPQYILIACGQGDGWTFVDTRPGAKRGRIGQYVKGNSDFTDPAGYASLPVLLDAVTRSLQNGDTVDGYFYATVVDGRLDWELIDLGPLPTPPNPRGSESDLRNRSTPDTEPVTGAGHEPYRRLALPTQREE